MSAIPVVERYRAWTPDDLLELPEDADWRRYEIVDGSLVVSPAPGKEHGYIGALLRRIVDRQLPDELLALDAMGVVLGTSYRIPDLIVAPLRARTPTGNNFVPADVLLAVEIVSPASVTTDRITKPAQYAAAGIGAYWRVETDPVSVTAYALSGEVYAEIGTWRAGETARLSEPFAVEIGIDRLA